ncbi:aldo/keto reductase [Candidatus Bathyarchaeota archaeon]|nr:MAG: aldo/keto reductase [Candidatus Bathyarchaeota archaeon]
MEFRPLGRTHESIPVIGLGTWGIGGEMGSDTSRDEAGIQALKLGLDLEMKFIDTAEMYGAGHSEEVVSQALEGRRDRVFVASKVSPRHFAYDDVLGAAKRSLKRLRLKQMDLYQLHWPNPRIPISETMRAMEKLVGDGLVRHIGVSNFSVEQIKEAQQSLSHEKIVSNQVEFSLIDRGVEAGILQYCQKEGLTLIAYSPLGQGKIPRGRGSSFKVLDEIAGKLGKSRNQIALNWVLQHDSVVAIPKAADTDHVKENAEVAEWKLGSEDYQRLGKAFS